jgi:hypothetical protein
VGSSSPPPSWLLAACGGGHDPKLPAGLAQLWRADATSKVNALASGSCDAQRADDLADWLAENS